MLTADTITDEQIRELMAVVKTRDGDEESLSVRIHWLCSNALYKRQDMTDMRPNARRADRQRVADIINAVMDVK